MRTVRFFKEPVPANLHVTFRVCCQNEMSKGRTREDKQIINFNYKTQLRAFRGLCPYCDAPIALSVKTIICLIEEPDFVESIPGHWVTLDGDFNRNINAHEDLMAMLPWYPEDQPPVIPTWRKVVNWFK